MNNIITLIIQFFKSLFAPSSKLKPKIEEPDPPVTITVIPEVKPETKVEVVEPVPIPEPPPLPQSFDVQSFSAGKKTRTRVSDGNLEKVFGHYSRGLFTVGVQKAINFIDQQKERLMNLNLSPSAINVMISVSENEGNLDAINTWDNSFMTFGMFQWTLGAGGDKGELPALLKKIKEKAPASFEKHFKAFHLDVAEDTGKVYGYLTSEGNTVNTEESKAPFRSADWAFRFWRAGQDEDVMAIEIEHAASRLMNFYWKADQINGCSIAEIITSEYGVALILDNHVNRPGYVKSCIKQAWQESGLGNPTDWTTADENKVIDAYIRIRADYGRSPMTDANKRAAVTKKYLTQGLIAADRGSFVYDPFAERTLNPMSNVGVLPEGYRERDFEDMMHYDDMEIESFDSDDEI